MTPAPRPSIDAPRARVLAPWAGVAATLAVIVTLNVVAHPLVSAAAAIGFAALALRLGHVRLVVTATVTGIGLVLLEPLLVHVFGGGLGAASEHASIRGGVAGTAWLAGAAMRLPAQVLACLPLLLVEPEAMIGWIGRLAPRAAFAAALAGHIGPMLRDDAERAREEVRAAGGTLVGPFDPAWNAGSWRSLWRAVAGGAFDRSATTAIALEARGFGIAPPTTAQLRHPLLAPAVDGSPGRDVLVVVLAVVAVAVGIAGRAAGAFAATSFDVFAGAASRIGVASLVLGATFALLAFVLADPLRPRRSPVPAPVDRPTDVDAALDASLPVATGASSAVVATPTVAASSGLVHQVAARAAVPVLRVRGLELWHAGATTRALTGIDLDVAAGELVVVAGASGSGKSTLLDAVAGIAPHATGGRVRGAVELAGRPVLGRDVAERSRDLATAMQEPERQVLATTVGAEVALGLRLRGLPTGEIERRAARALRDGGLAHLAGRHMSTLSGGELQRVLLAAALATQPKLLLLDEPTAQLDVVAARSFWQHVRALSQQTGVAVLATEHRLDAVRGLADRVVHMHAIGGTPDLASSAGFASSAGVAPSAEPVLPATGLRPDAVGEPAPTTLPARTRPALGPPRLVVHGLRVHAAGTAHLLVDGLDLVARASEVVAIRGDNGSGKSTLLRSLRGLHPCAGSVLLDGTARGGLEASATRIAWLSQRAGVLLDGATVRQVLADRARRWRLPSGVVDHELRGAGLHELADRHPHDLSVGQRQRLAVSVATLHRPALWLLDEPSRGMDATALAWLEQRVLAHAAQGGVVLLVTHEPQLVRELATQLVDLSPRRDWRASGARRAAPGSGVEPEPRVRR